MDRQQDTAYADEFVHVEDAYIASWHVHASPERRLPTLEGKCPKCHHNCDYPVPEEVLQGATASAAKNERPSQLTRLVICNCRNAHSRPAGIKLGCGRYWLARLTKEGDTYTLSVQRDLGMLPAASALADSLETQDARVQKTAEKWLGGITALFGLFSLTGVATGKDALLGLSQGHRWLVATFMLTAVGTAVYAIVMGYLAAYDWVRLIRLDQNDGQLIRFEQNKSGYAARTAGRLQHAVYAALGALSAITVMMLLVWFLPRVA